MIPELSSEFEHSVVPVLANHLWQSTVVLCLAGLLTLALRRNQARVRYWLWMVASVKFLVPFSLLIGLGSHLHMTGGTRILDGSRAGIYAVVNQAEQPFSKPIVVPPVIARASSRHDVLVLLPAVIWLGGSLAIVLLWVVRWRRVARVVREAVPVDGGREVEALRRVSSAAGLRRPVPLLCSQERMEPGIFGIGRPVLLWPAGISEHLDDAHIEAILAHEMQHVRRRDNLAALLHMAVEALFWFHPLVWLVGARLVEERERACDEDVLLAGGRPHVYAESILKTCQFCLESPLRCVSGITGADLKVRIAEIMAKRAALKMGFGRKALLALAGGIAVVAPVVLGQTNASPNIGQAADGNVNFEVATIRPADPMDQETGFKTRGRHVVVENEPLTNVAIFAYGVHPKQLVGGPSWMNDTRFTIDGIPDTEGQLSVRQMQGMVRRLLEDRFHLKTHKQRREIPVYAIQIAKGGTKLAKSKSDPKELPDQTGTRNYINFRNNSMIDLALGMQFILDRPVVDETGLTDKYDFQLRWTPDGVQTTDPNAPPSIYTAFQEQLGLKLTPTRAYVDVLVIDQIEKPSEN